jgi:hypothetical protein
VGHCVFVKVMYMLKIRILGFMFSRIDFLRMPHKGWMKNGSSCAQSWMKIITPVIGRLFALLYVGKTPRVLFLLPVCCVLGKFVLKLLLVEAYSNKVRQVCFVVVGLGSPL